MSTRLVICDLLVDKPHTLVNQNSRFMEVRYFPDHFVASQLRSWYREKKYTTTHTKKDKYNIGVYFDQVSNYTQIVWSRTERVGCAIFRVKEGMRLICNYWPFTGLDQPGYLQGPACSECPRRYPMCSKAFLSLCTNRAERAFSVYALLNTFVMVTVAILLQNFEV
jgi:Cysteine-rich secretory protein family